MNETELVERLDRLEKKVDEGFLRTEAGFAHVNSLIDSLATLCVREFTAIQDHFTEVDGSLEAMDGKFEAFARRMDDEVEQRHVLGERVAKLEQTL
jgi:hypothetical protein